MTRFITYCDYDAETQVMSEAEFKTKGQPNDWEEYVWQDVADAATALARHDEAMDAYDADNKAERPIKDTY